MLSLSREVSDRAATVRGRLQEEELLKWELSEEQEVASQGVDAKTPWQPGWVFLGRAGAQSPLQVS